MEVDQTKRTQPKILRQENQLHQGKINEKYVSDSFAFSVCGANEKKLSLVGLNDHNQNSHMAFSSASSFCWFRLFRWYCFAWSLPGFHFDWSLVCSFRYGYGRSCGHISFVASKPKSFLQIKKKNPIDDDFLISIETRLSLLKLLSFLINER